MDATQSRPVRAIVLGAGYRGRAYAAYAVAHPDQLEIAGVADPEQAETISAPRAFISVSLKSALPRSSTFLFRIVAVMAADSPAGPVPMMAMS